MTNLPQTPAELAARIDHTLLKPEATANQIDRLCDEAREHGFAAVCVNPIRVARCVERLAGSGIAVASVAGFPLGATLSEHKAAEAQRAVDSGASEVDMVIHIADLRAGGVDRVTRDIAIVVSAVRRSRADAIVKVILETAALTDEQIVAGCRCAEHAGADFVKTSTGFHPAGGATVEAVRLLRRHAERMQVKAAGGIRTLEAALAMLEAGADRLGMSASTKVLAEFKMKNAK